MKTIEMTDKEMFAVELALRIVLCELLNREDLMIELVQAGAHNIAIGSFGDKAYKPEDSQDWIQYLQPLREVINKLDPEFKRRCDEFGDAPYRLPEEDGMTQEEADAEVNEHDTGDPLYKSPEYKEALTKMNSIKDRPICVFVWNDLDMPNRIQTMSIVAAEHLERKGAGRITVACLNQTIKVNL